LSESLLSESIIFHEDSISVFEREFLSFSESLSHKIAIKNEKTKYKTTIIEDNKAREYLNKSLIHQLFIFIVSLKIYKKAFNTKNFIITKKQLELVSFIIYT